MDPLGGAMNAAMADSNNQLQMQGANMMTAQASAQAAAIRPGDEAMSCEAIQAEMGVMFNDPAFQGAIASMGAAAQSQQNRAKAAQASAVGAGIAGTAASVAGSMIPGMGWLGSAAIQAQQASILAQMPAANRDRAQMMSDMTSVLPQMYRGQRIYEIAQAKKCAFLNT
jgi:hypothetical protein